MQSSNWLSVTSWPTTILQIYLTRLEAAGKLHWIEQRVDPSWEVSAITRHTFDRYGWNDRPALGFRQVGVSEFPLVIGVIGGSPEIYALALSTTVDKIPEVWERGQRHPIDPVIVPTGLCKEIIIRSSAIDLGSLPQVVWTPNKIPDPISPRRWSLPKMPKPAGATSAPTGCS